MNSNIFVCAYVLRCNMVVDVGNGDSYTIIILIKSRIFIRDRGMKSVVYGPRPMYLMHLLFFDRSSVIVVEE